MYLELLGYPGGWHHLEEVKIREIQLNLMAP